MGGCHQKIVEDAGDILFATLQGLRAKLKMLTARFSANAYASSARNGGNRGKDLACLWKPLF